VPVYQQGVATVKALIGLWEDEHGGVSVETALVLVLMSIVSFAAYQSLGGIVATKAGQAGDALVH